MIPFVDLSHIHQELHTEFYQALDHSLQQSDFVIGTAVNQFEKEFATYCDSQYAIGVSSGTAALFLTLHALGVREGDEVIVPAHTFIATAMAVSQCGAKPVFVDVDSETWNISWDNIQPHINSKTKGIIAVHIYGNPADMESIYKPAKKQGLFVIEDAAQAHGAYYKEKRIGSLADAACFSFYPSKNLGALGEGGAITTNNHELFKKINQLRDYGRSDKYKHELIGYNLRLQGLQASFLSIKLKHLDTWNQERNRLMKMYQEKLNDTFISFQKISSQAKAVYHLGVIQTQHREAIIQNFEKHQIGYGIHYPIPCHQQPAYPDDHQLHLKNSEELSQTVLSLPLYVGLQEEQINQVIKAIKNSL